MLTLAVLPFLQYVGYPGLFLVVFAESGTVIGFWLPGASLLFTAGLLAAKGVFNPWILIPTVTIAAILGDNAGYWFGNRIGIKLFTRPNSRWFHQDHLRQTQHFYEKHGPKAIVLARFIPIVRSFAPIVAGIASMEYRKFMVYNLAGAFVWATGVTFAGFYLGEKIPGIQKYITVIVIGIIILTLIPVFWEAYKQYRDRNEPASI